MSGHSQSVVESTSENNNRKRSKSFPAENKQGTEEDTTSNNAISKTISNITLVVEDVDHGTHSGTNFKNRMIKQSRHSSSPRLLALTLRTGAIENHVNRVNRVKSTSDITKPIKEQPKHTNASSKYDFVKVRVTLGESHYYILSRFLISRVLTVTRIPYQVAVRIALELKKHFVDENILEVKQEDMENLIFQVMKKYGYGDKHISLYKMMTKFHHKRVPLIILISGTRCIGKSTLATLLAERLNMSSVIQTNIVYELMNDMANTPISTEPICFRRYSDKSKLLEQFKRECQVVRKGVSADIQKCLTEGKSMIIEGFHLDPSLYFDIFDELSSDGTPQDSKEDKQKKKKGILSVFLFTLDRPHHRLAVENWLSNRTEKDLHDLGSTLKEQVSAMVENFRCIQDYLLSFNDKLQVVPINWQALEVHLDMLHDSVLNKIEQLFDTAPDL